MPTPLELFSTFTCATTPDERLVPGPLAACTSTESPARRAFQSRLSICSQWYCVSASIIGNLLLELDHQNTDREPSANSGSSPRVYGWWLALLLTPAELLTTTDGRRDEQCASQLPPARRSRNPV